MTEPRKRSRAAIIWSVLAIFLVVIAVLEFGDRSKQATTVSPEAPKMLMPAPLEEIAAIEIAVDGNLHRFSRDDQNTWFYHGIHAGPQSVHESEVQEPRAQPL